MPTKNQINLANTFIAAASEENKAFYKAIIDYLMSKNFNPKKLKTKDFGLDFYNSKLKQTIAKLYDHDFRLKYFAGKEYSEKFHESVKIVIEEFDGKYTGCYGCGRCAGEPEGYTYIYQDGKTVFRCGRELNTIPNADLGDIKEIKRLIDVQCAYWEKDNK